MLDRQTQNHLGHLLKTLYDTLYVRQAQTGGAESATIRTLAAKLQAKDTKSA